MKKITTVLIALLIMTVSFSQELKYEFSRTFKGVEASVLEDATNKYFAKKYLNKKGDIELRVEHNLINTKVKNFHGFSPVEIVVSYFYITTEINDDSVYLKVRNSVLNSSEFIYDSTDLHNQIQEFADGYFAYLSINESGNSAQAYFLSKNTDELVHMQSYLIKSANRDLSAVAVAIIGTLAGTIVGLVPIMTDVSNPGAYAAAGIGIAGVTGILSLSLKVSSITAKKKAGNLIEFH